jgi:MFS family permease
MDNPFFDIKTAFPSLLDNYGIISGLAYTLPYSVVGLFMGSLADQYNRKYILASTLALGGISSFLTGS